CCSAVHCRPIPLPAARSLPTPASNRRRPPTECRTADPPLASRPVDRRPGGSPLPRRGLLARIVLERDAQPNPVVEHAAVLAGEILADHLGDAQLAHALGCGL